MWLPRIWAGIAAHILSTFALANSLNPDDYHPHHVIYRDVVIIGGGSTGTYTAVRLTDHQKSIILIEKEPQLGGHAQTYTAPNGYTIDYGVIVFAAKKVVTDYFSRFGVPLIQLPTSARPSPHYFDFATGKAVEYTAPAAAAQGAAFEAYATQLAKYPSLQRSFNTSYPLAPDLLLTFGQFVKKYDLGAMVPTTFITNQGFAPILDIPMLYMFKYLNTDQLNSTRNGFLTTKNHDVYALYAAAAIHLGASNVLTSTVPIAMDRSSSPIKVLVQTPHGRKLILAKELVSTIPPTPHKLRSYDLTRHEKSLFSQFKADGYYTGILKTTGLNTSLTFVNSDPTLPYSVPKLPGIYSISGSPATGLTQVYYGSPTTMSSAAVKADIEASLHKVQRQQGVKVRPAEWVTFSNHSPFNLEVSKEALEAGFYKRLYALRGQMHTFWNGAAWQTQDSSVLWQYTEDEVLPPLLKALECA